MRSSKSLNLLDITFYMTKLSQNPCRDSFITKTDTFSSVLNSFHKVVTLNSLESFNNSVSRVMFKSNNTDIGKNITANIYLFEAEKEILENGVKYVQSYQ